MLVTDTLASDGAASREILSTVPPLPREPAEQPRGSLPSTDAATRTTHAQVQIPTAGPAFSLCSWPHQQPVSLRATSHERAPLSLVPCSGLCDMARGDVRSECSLTETSSDLGDFRERLYPTCYAPGALPNHPDWTDIGDLGFLSLRYSFQEIALYRRYALLFLNNLPKLFFTTGKFFLFNLCCFYYGEAGFVV